MESHSVRTNLTAGFYAIVLRPGAACRELAWADLIRLQTGQAIATEIGRHEKRRKKTRGAKSSQSSLWMRRRGSGSPRRLSPICAIAGTLKKGRQLRVRSDTSTEASNGVRSPRPPCTGSLSSPAGARMLAMPTWKRHRSTRTSCPAQGSAHRARWMGEQLRTKENS